ncbi:MAG: tetratricopeptide repeat protein [Planctomycetaceae bacterium]|nr:tetratricopeptide repeat protein [Planctomycetaceae bacterium]
MSAVTTAGSFSNGIKCWASLVWLGLWFGSAVTHGQNGESVGQDVESPVVVASDHRQVLEPENQKERCRQFEQQNKAASSPKELTALVEAIDNDLKNYQYLSAYEDYLKSLAAYALNRRGELRLEIGFEFALVGNQDPTNQAFDQALADFERAIELNPGQWKAHANRGIVLGKRGQWADAAAALQRSIALRPGQTHAYFNLAEIEFQQGHFVASIENYGKVLATSPDDVQALNGQALAMIAEGRCRDAIAILEKLVEHKSSEPWLLANLGDAYQANGDWEQAEKVYLRGLELEQHSGIYRRLAWLYATCPADQWRRPEAAVAIAKRSIAGTKQVKAAQWDTLAAAQAANGAFDEAVDSLAQALLQEPENQSMLQRRELYQQKQAFVQTVRVASEPKLDR